MIQGERVTLRPAKSEERKLIFDMAIAADYLNDDLWANGVADFEAEYSDDYFDAKMPSICGGMMICLDNNPIGFAIYDQTSYENDWINQGVMTISDIWLDGEQYIGKSYGSDAIKALMKHLHEQYDIHTFYSTAEIDNHRSIRAFEKSGYVQFCDSEKLKVIKHLFTQTAIDSPLFAETYLCDDDVLMVCEYSVNGVSG